MYYTNLYSKKYDSENENLSVVVYIIPKLSGWEISTSAYTFFKTYGANVKTTENNKVLTIIPTDTTTDWLAVVNEYEDMINVDIYITEYSNNKINIDHIINPIANKLCEEAKKEYKDKKKSEIRLYSYKKDSMWLEQECPTTTFEYDYCRFAKCLLDKSFSTPTEDGFFFGIIKKTIVDKKKHLVDIVVPISEFYNIKDLDNMEHAEYKCNVDMLLDVLETLVEIKQNYFFFRIFYHYASKDSSLMDLYKKAVSETTQLDLLENDKIIKMLEMYKKDVLSNLKKGFTGLENIFEILYNKLPTDGVIFHLSISNFHKKKGLNKENKLLLAYNTGLYENKSISTIDTKLCTNYNIKKGDDNLYYLIEK